MHYGNAFEGAHPCWQLAGTSMKRFTKSICLALELQWSASAGDGGEGGGREEVS